MTTERREPALPQLKKMLGKAAANRIARDRASRERPRRGGYGGVIVALAALTLAGGAMAATGVWNPTRGWHPIGAQQWAQAARWPAAGQTGASHGPVRHSVTAAPRSSKEASGHPPDASERRVEFVTPPSIGDPMTDEALSHEHGSVDDGGPAGGSPTGVPPKVSGNTGVGKEPGGEEPGRVPNPPGEQPGTEKPAPQGTQTSFHCSPEAIQAGLMAKCFVTVEGEGGAPTGAVSFATAGRGSFTSDSCALVDDGDGRTSSCTLAYTPNATGAHQLTASYAGDSTHGPSAASFLLNSF
jgi:hypothetical protein